MSVLVNITYTYVYMRARTHGHTLIYIVYQHMKNQCIHLAKTSPEPPEVARLLTGSKSRFALLSIDKRMRMAAETINNNTQAKPHVFVLNFDGDVTASQVIFVCIYSHVIVLGRLQRCINVCIRVFVVRFWMSPVCALCKFCLGCRRYQDLDSAY